MPDTIKGAVAKRENGPQALITQYRQDFATVLPTHLRADTWVRVAQGLLRRDAKLRQAAENNPHSFLAALLECARLGLEPGSTFHLVPFGAEIVGVEDYTGVIELIYRAGAVSSVKAEIVYQNDDFHYTPDMERPEHRVDWFGDRGEMIGVYAYGIMKDGATSRIVMMSKREVEAVKAVSKTAKRSDSPWQQWPDRMWLKTAVKQLAKWVPSSPEYLGQQMRGIRDGQQPAVQNAPGPATPAPADYIEGEVVDLPAPARDYDETSTNQPDTVEDRVMRRIFALLKTGGITERDDRLAIAGVMLTRPIASFDDLTAADGALIAETLQDLSGTENYRDKLAELVAAAREDATTTEGTDAP